MIAGLVPAGCIGGRDWLAEKRDRFVFECVG